MSPSRQLSRRELLGTLASAGLAGSSLPYSRIRNDSGVTTNENHTDVANETTTVARIRESNTPQVAVENIVRTDVAAYEVTFAYAIPDGTTVARSNFVEGTTSSTPPKQLASDRHTFTVEWTPENPAERLIWEVGREDGPALRAVTKPHRRVRENWTLSLEELRKQFRQFDPDGLTVRTGARSQRTMYLHGESSKAMFRIWDDGLVTYRSGGKWWEVTAKPQQLIPISGPEIHDAPRDAQKNNQYTFTVANSPYDGSQWMSALLREGSHWGMSVFYFFPNHIDVTPGLDPRQPDEVYSSIRFKLVDNWTQSNSNATCKIYWAGCNLSAGGAGKGGNPPTGDDGWSVRVYTRGKQGGDSVSLGGYVYHLDQQGAFGDLIEWPAEIRIGQWYTLDVYVRLNSVGEDGDAAKDGVLNAYLNGEQQMKRSNLRWRTTEALGFDRLGPGCYWGGREVAPQDNFIYYDRFRFNKSRR